MDEQEKLSIEAQNEAVSENAQIQVESEKTTFIAENRRIGERVKEDTDRLEEQRRMDTARLEESRHEDDLRHDEQKRMDERRKSEARRKEGQKAKYPHGMRNGNDLVTTTARLVYDIGKSAKEDISIIKESAEKINAEHITKQIDRAEMDKQYRRDMAEFERHAEAAKSADMKKDVVYKKDPRPALARCGAHEQSLSEKVQAHIKSLNIGHDHDMVRDR